jgi:hypothetical protein
MKLKERQIEAIKMLAKYKYLTSTQFVVLLVLYSQKGTLTKVLEELTSTGEPLFFKPLLYNHKELFRLYMISRFDINKLDIQGKNIFYRYVEQAFLAGKLFPSFKSDMISLMNLKVDIINFDENGLSVFHKIITPKTNHKLYLALLILTKVDLYISDDNGRTIAHYAVLNNNFNLVRMLIQQDLELFNKADYFGVLPISYAILEGSYKIVLELLKYKINISAGQDISDDIKYKYQTRLIQIDKIKQIVTDKDMIRKIDILLSQIKNEFALA